MNTRSEQPAWTGGIALRDAVRDRRAGADFQDWLRQLRLDGYVETREESDIAPGVVRFRLRPELARDWAPGADTLQLCRILDLDTRRSVADLEREILLAMLLGPVEFYFPSYEELAAAVRIRVHIVEAARRTALAFHTSEAERPPDYWTYAEQSGFTVLPGKSLITALERATQPQPDGALYAFSCYRATEYVILLGLAREIERVNPALHQRLQRLWQRRAIKSGEFHEVFLREYGSMSEPLPLQYFVPGDRTWFRNPDERSSDVAGYEGSWVMYLGDGLFTNFWKRDQPYTFTGKCIEIYHWRNAIGRDAAGEPYIDEAIVEARVRETLRNPEKMARILNEMLRHREPAGVHGGGCVDTTRETVRWVCPGTSDLRLPDA